MIYFKDYEQYQRTKGNKMTHLIGVSLTPHQLLLPSTNQAFPWLAGKTKPKRVSW